MPPCNWPQNSVFVTEFALWRSLCSSTLMWLTEKRGRVLHLLCFGSGLGKLFRQLLFVACNAVSSYPTANSLPSPSRPQSEWKKETVLPLSTLVNASIEHCSFSVLPLIDCANWRTTVWNHLLNVSQVLISIVLTFLF